MSGTNPQFDGLRKMSDIRSLITAKTRESEVIEYKDASQPSLNPKEIAKDVSAMANSNGGVIIYGVSAQPTDKTLPKDVTGIHQLHIESFDQIVNANIRPVITGIEKRIISGRKLKVMVVAVPKSDAAPHQNLKDRRYYRRSLTESRPMEHYLVELYFGKRRRPILSVDLEIPPIDSLQFGGDGFSEPVDIKLKIQNTGKSVAKYTQLILLFPVKESISLDDTSGLNNIDNLNDGKFQVRQFNKDSGVIHTGPAMVVATLKVRFTKTWLQNKSKERQPLLQWLAHADGMSEQKGIIKGPSGA
jgi:hypothetical protein